MDLKDWVKTEREKRGWTQQQLADAAGLDRVEANALENGRNKGTTLRIRQALATAFKIPIQAVGGGAFDPGAPVSEDSQPEYRNLEGWPEAAAQLRARGYQPWQVEKAGTVRSLTTRPVTMEMAVAAMNLVMASLSPEDIERAIAETERRYKGAETRAAKKLDERSRGPEGPRPKKGPKK